MKDKNKYNEISEIEVPSNEICVIDEKNISNDFSYYYYKRKGVINEKYFFEDCNEKLIYNCKFNSFPENGSFKNDKDNKILFFSQESHFSGYSDIYIGRKENNKKEIYCKITPRNSTTNYYKYTIEFKNKSTKKDEILDVHIKNNYKDCNIYYGKKKENGQLICKFSSSSSMEYNFKIEIAPNVDQLFINFIIFISLRHVNNSKSATAVALAC